ncbi:DUF3299 domain-containing protein [Woodsholea maritima]|uniref:DUF3299 domain-containing protein n=1 Tax=Woodsholea maritima TaxID=240237 RepID=UPI00036A4F53|nr:DUF3299 domain-containing protein [Woodsholea maritima]
MKHYILSLFTAFALITTPSLAHEDSSVAEERLDLTWADLMPEGAAERLSQLQRMQALANGMDHFGTERMPQVRMFDVVEELDGKHVRLGGYVLPFDFAQDNKVSRFLLVPYVGACVHVPPPPPNQLVYVRTEEPVQIDGLWDPVYVEGILRTEQQDNDLGDTAYTLDLVSVTPYRP